MFDRMQPDVHARQQRPIHLLLASALLAVAVLALLAACDLPGSAATPTEPVFSPIVQHSPIVSSGQVIEQTIAGFCGAVHAGSFDQAYTYLSSAYKTTVTSASQIPNVLGQGTKLTNCAEFGSGGLLKINGTQATDDILVTVSEPGSPVGTQYPVSMSFVQVGSAWQIDGITR